LRARSVRAPERFVHLLAPGFPSRFHEPLL
jgi:hypothetical protein